MRVGGSVFLLAVGAILRWAVTYRVAHVDLTAVGLILMVAGAVGLAVSLLMMAMARRRTDVVQHPVMEPSPRRVVDDEEAGRMRAAEPRLRPER